MTFDLITIGDTAIDTLIPLIEAEIIIKEREKKLGLEYGRKIPVGESISMVAGNAANNAVGAARLGLKTAIYTNVGNDTDDQRIKSKFKQEGVDNRYIIENDNLPSNHHIVLDFKGERTILVHHQPWKFVLPDLEKSRWIYLTSLSPTYVKSNIMAQLVNYLERTGAKLFYNPGTFQLKNGVKKDLRLLSLVEIFIVNKEEAKAVLGYGPEENISIKKLLNGISTLGPNKVIITDNGAGSYGFDGEFYYQLGVFKAKLVEMTGCGDAYATGVLAALFYRADLAEAMRWGAANSAAVVECIGAQAGLLTYEQMQQKLQENSKIKSKVI